MRGRAFGAALSDAVDAALVEAFADIETPGEVAVVGLGSYARRELCPASDIDVLLVHNLRGRRSADTVRTIRSPLTAIMRSSPPRSKDNRQPSTARRQPPSRRASRTQRSAFSMLASTSPSVACI